jgi:hypothetical protein
MQTEEQASNLLKKPLDYPGLVRRRGAREHVRIWRAPAFDPESAWAIIADQQGWFVRRVVHVRQQRGGEVFHDTFGSEGRLPENDATALVMDLRTISVAPFVDSSGFGLDGARHGIAKIDGLCQVDISWWCAAPAEWRPLRDWYLRAIETLERYLPQSSVPLQAHHPWVE